MGSKLAQLSTRSELAFVGQVLAKERAEKFTAGGQVQLPGSSGKADGWVWHRSGDKVRREFWYPNEPNDANGKDQDVGAFYRNGQLDDADNDKKFYFLCECLLI